MKSLHNFVDGEWVAPSTGRAFPVLNPATGEVIAEVADSAAQDASCAIDAASKAFESWSTMAGQERSRILRRLAQAVTDQADRLARVLTEEQGKPLAEAKWEVVSGASSLDWYADEARRIYGEIIPGATNEGRVWVTYQAVGVVGAITPWNFPSSMITRKLAPALAAGCTVVLKPAEQTPLSALLLAELFDEAGLPPGVFNVVTTADPAAIGREFMTNRAIRKISFTGSTEVGKLLLAGAAEQVKRVSMELGGHAPFLVFEDADIDQAVNAAFANKFVNGGQTCVCANRIYVHEEVLDTFATRFLEKIRDLRPGNGLDEATTIGPLIDEAAVQKVAAHVEDATAKGARLLVGGHRLVEDGFGGGSFFAPTVLRDVTDEMDIVHEETFGPVAPLIPFRDEKEVIQRANQTNYGLAAYLFSHNIDRVLRVAERLDFGMVAVNSTALTQGPQAPFGGIKESGLGREGGTAGLHEFLEMKTVSITTSR